MAGEKLPFKSETFEIPEASPEGVLVVFDQAVRFLNIVRTSNHISPSETKKDVEDRKERYQEIFRLTVGYLETMYPGGNWEERARKEADSRFNNA
jgi:putative alpha-1,2-mannosidase